MFYGYYSYVWLKFPIAVLVIEDWELQGLIENPITKYDGAFYENS